MNTAASHRLYSPQSTGHLNRTRKQRNARSKSGCLTCRIKRVKCNDRKPVCTRCLRNARVCSYNELGGNLYGGLFSKLSDNTVDPISSLDTRLETLRVEDLRYFQRNWDKILHIPGIYRILELSRSNPVMLDTIFAISTCHFRGTCQQEQQQTRQLRVAQHVYLSRALIQFQSMFSAAQDCCNKTNVEVFLTSALLLNILNFSASGSAEGGTDQAWWTIGDCESLNGWLALQSGIKPLILSSTSQISETRTLMGHIMFGRDDGQWPTPNFKFDRDKLPESWVKALDLNDLTTVEVLGQPAMILHELRQVKPLSLNVFKNMLFVWKMSERFRLLISQKEERAVWMFGYWFGLMCRFEGVWWCKERVTQEYRAVYSFLDQLHLPDRNVTGQFWAEMMRQLQRVPKYESDACSRMLEGGRDPEAASR